MRRSLPLLALLQLLRPANTGAIERPVVELHGVGAAGASAELQHGRAAGSSATAAKPAMAWNAWNTFSVNGKPIRGGRPEYEGIAEAMIERGYVAAGYKTLSTVCTDWQPPPHRAVSGPDSSFKQH